jgi:hypothetical protein
MKKQLSLFLFVVLLLPTFAMANEGREELITSIHKLVWIVGFLIGLILMISAGYKMKVAADTQGPQSNKGVILVTLLAGVVMMNASGALSTYIVTMLGSTSGHCFILDSSQSVAANCWSAESSGLTGELKGRIEKLSNGSTAQAFMENINVIVGIFQVIGLIYFLVGAYGLVQVSNGSSRDSGYGKPIITMFAAALIVDIPHTAEMAISTLEKIGINF